MLDTQEIKNVNVDRRGHTKIAVLNNIKKCYQTNTEIGVNLIFWFWF